MADVEERVRAIIADQAMVEPSDVTRDSTLDSLGIDSMMLVEAIFTIEEAFDISIPFNANEPGAGQFDISSIGAIVDGIEHLVAQKTS